MGISYKKLWVLKVTTLPNVAECITTTLNDLDTYPVSRLTMNAIEILDRLFQS